MISVPMQDTSRLCLHTITTKPWSLERAIDAYAEKGVTGITVWRQALEGRDPAKVGQRIRNAGLEIVSLCRGGFFPASSVVERKERLDENRRAIEQASALGAPLIVLVPGAHPSQSLGTSREQIREGIEAILPLAEASNVRLGIEPLHPMYADTRSAINSMAMANNFCDQFDSPYLGVVVDVYHLWWEPALENEIRRCGASGNLFAFHVSDWRLPTEDLLNDRGLMGEGCIPIRKIRGWVEQSGFNGFIEVEIFSNRYWAIDQDAFLESIVQAYLKYV